jgi:FkbM family methyltransferase
VGAARPEFLSISNSFRKLGWTIIAVEPNPAFCDEHRALGYEIFEYACSDRDEDNVDFTLVDTKGAQYQGGPVSFESFSSLGLRGEFAELYKTTQIDRESSTIKVNVRRLDTILAQHAPYVSNVDVVTVDVEGWEIEVMNGFSLQRYAPKVVVLENLMNDVSYRTFMHSQGYTLHRVIPPNDLYFHPLGFQTSSRRHNRET